ncbi:uncharacterized protein UTRI_01527 [Ustilago trichophora]|uniref:Bromo domain-containing protein n=1 Tax=Ustilago trichophora TaxID=86804 RepID=A0A5C3E0E5_9BASI|nr:uncharacterized protein UTRI_01527 [Ustilago trichophora]
MNPMIPSPHALQPSALAKLSLRDKLLLAQAVHEIGTSPPDWGRVSALLLAHPLIRQQSRLEQAANAGLTLGRIFGTRECERAWTALMRQRGLVLAKDEAPPEPPTPTTPKPKEPRGLQPRTDKRSQLALAQLLYAERIEELKDQIREKEEQFKSLVKEIDEIKSGKADARLEMELRIEMENLANGPPLPPSTPGSAAPSVAGPGTPASTASTTPKSGKKGRARGESSATNPGGDLSKISPIRTDSAPNSAKANKVGDRRASIDETPSKLIPGPTTLPSTPSIVLPKPGADAASTVGAASTSAAAPVESGDKPVGEMTTEEAEQAVATAATEAAVKALQEEKAAAASALQSEVDKAAEKVIETETNLELSAQAEGDASATSVPAQDLTAGAPATQATTTEAAAASTPAEEAKMKPNEAPAAEVVVKEMEPVVDATPTPTPTPAATAVAAAADAAGNKRKRDEEESEPASTQDATAKQVQAPADESPVKKARTAAEEVTKAPSSDVEMDSEDEAEAAVGDSAAPSEAGRRGDEEEEVVAKEKTAVAEAPRAEGESDESKKDVEAAEKESKEQEKAIDEDSSSSPSSSSSSSSSEEEAEAEDQVKPVESPRKHTPAKEEDEMADATTKDASSAAAKSKSPVQPEPEATKEDEDDEASSSSDSSSSPAAKQPSRTTPVRTRPSSTPRAKPEPASRNTPPSSTVDKTAKRKTAQVLSMLLTEVSNHTHGNLFHAPIKEQDAPDYYTLIKAPLDIKTIKARIKEGSIGSAKQLRKALALMFANSLIYNRPGTEVHRMASEMFAASEEIFRRYEGTQRF